MYRTHLFKIHIRFLGYNCLFGRSCVEKFLVLYMYWLWRLMKTWVIQHFCDFFHNIYKIYKWWKETYCEFVYLDALDINFVCMLYGSLATT